MRFSNLSQKEADIKRLQWIIVPYDDVKCKEVLSGVDIAGR